MGVGGQGRHGREGAEGLLEAVLLEEIQLGQMGMLHLEDVLPCPDGSLTWAGRDLASRGGRELPSPKLTPAGWMFPWGTRSDGLRRVDMEKELEREELEGERDEEKDDTGERVDDSLPESLEWPSVAGRGPVYLSSCCCLIRCWMAGSLAMADVSVEVDGVETGGRPCSPIGLNHSV